MKQNNCIPIATIKLSQTFINKYHVDEISAYFSRAVL